MFRYSLFIGIFCVACTAGMDFEEVNYEHLFHGGTSKVWLVDQVRMNQANIGPHLHGEKDVLIFHSSGKFQYVSLKKISEGNLSTGYFYLDSKKGKMSLKFQEKTWEFNLNYVEEDSVLLVPKSGSKMKQSLKIIPLPLL